MTKDFVLGLVQIIDKAYSKSITEYVKSKLGEFQSDFDEDIFASTHDGAAVMVKY